MPYKAVLIELRNTLLCSSIENIQVATNTFKSLLYCSATVEYQCGRISEEQYLKRLASDFGDPQEKIEASIQSVRNSMRVDDAALKSMTALKDQLGGQLKFYATITMSKQDYALVRKMGLDWSLFEHIFVSSEIGVQKPDSRFYHRILDNIGLQAEEVIVVDDDTDNILMALSLGLQGVVYQEDSMSRSILNLIQIDPVRRGTRFLQQNARNLPSSTSTGVSVKENFAQLLLLELTQDR